MQIDTQQVQRTHKEIKLAPADETRFWAKVDKKGPDECWLWKSGVTKQGYGRFKVNKRMVTSHRTMFTIFNGPIPHDGSHHGICVCHKCDVPGCCNPAHLFLGTAADNINDRQNKGRTARGEKSGARLHPEKLARGDANGSRLYPERLRRGEAVNTAKLTAEKVVEIRALYAAGGFYQRQLAEQFGVTQAIISKIILRLIWGHI